MDRLEDTVEIRALTFAALASPLEPRGYDPYNSADSYDAQLRDFRREQHTVSILKRQAQ